MQPEMITNVLISETEFAQKTSKKSFRTTFGLWMDM